MQTFYITQVIELNWISATFTFITRLLDKSNLHARCWDWVWLATLLQGRAALTVTWREASSASFPTPPGFLAFPPINMTRQPSAKMPSPSFSTCCVLVSMVTFLSSTASFLLPTGTVRVDSGLVCVIKACQYLSLLHQLILYLERIPPSCLDDTIFLETLLAKVQREQRLSLKWLNSVSFCQLELWHCRIMRCRTNHSAWLMHYGPLPATFKAALLALT